jgi:hypothetical protein
VGALYCYCNLNKNYVLNLVNFSKFEGIWLLFFGAWFQLFGLFWMVTGLPPQPVLMKLKYRNRSARLKIITGMT